MRFTGSVACAVALAGAICLESLAAPPDVPKVELVGNVEPVFEEHIFPIFEAHCFGCHGEKKRKAGLDLRSRVALLAGSESGAVISPGKPEKSLLYEMVHEKHMPPEGRDPLSESQVDTLRRWISAGAPFQDGAFVAAHRLNQHDILPILRLRCTVCHGRQKQEGGLDVRTRASILNGGESGPAMVLGKPEESLLLERIHAGEMPPLRSLVEVSVKPVEENEVELLAEWIRAGAPEELVPPDIAGVEPDPLVSDEDRQFWSFQPPKAAPVPRVQHVDRVRNPVDSFVLEKLEEKGSSLSPEADRLTLLRRATFDLTGLPPTPEEVEDFLADTRPRAYERRIDRLLSSPRYGERWGRHWLDLAGYSDSEGGQEVDRVRSQAYRYRDYVIRSLNRDKPYDRFLMEQIAGDELADYRNAETLTEEIYDNLVATGFLRMAPDSTYAGITGFVPDRLEIIDDELEVLTSAVMGLTLRCSRCHSHKFDPLPQRDYYRLADIFKGAFDENDWLDPKKGRYLPYAPANELRVWKAHDKKLRAEIEAVKAPLAKKQEEYARKHAEKKPDAEALKKLEPAFAEVAKAAEKKIQAIKARKKPKPRIRALWDRGEPTPTYNLIRGDYQSRGRLVGPGVPAVLTDGKTPFEYEPPFPGATSTGRRLAFARWLTEPQNPLTARVRVNRVWKHHFGSGIVATLDNFGTTGARPTHPELLDWLAVEFVRDGWSIKRLHRLLMTSSTYRQSAEITAAHAELDPENRLLSRMPLRRMEGETLRDSLLQVAGRLDLTPFGPPDGIRARGDGLVLAASDEKLWRRTIYIQQRRTARLTILDNFDLPRMSPNCVERRESIVAPQALHLLNNNRVHELSRYFAERVWREAGASPEAQVERAYRIALGREPTSEERSLALASLEELTRDWADKVSSVRVDVEAKVHLWIREVRPDAVYENDLISVWSRGRDGGRRWGLLEFDVGDLSAAEWKAAHLELGIVSPSRAKQSARLIPPGISGATWNSYQATKSARSVALESFGRLEAEPTEVPVGSYAETSPASERDLKLLADAARMDSRIALVLIADEDGTLYARDWDDGIEKHKHGNVPRLVVHKEMPRDEAARRALQNVCHALMNSAAFLYID